MVIRITGTIPFHLITREFFQLVRNRLTADGILAINYIGPPQNDFVTASLFATLGEVFGSDRIEAYRTSDDPDVVQVVTVLAFQRQMALIPGWRQPSDSGADAVSYDLRKRRLDTSGAGGEIITDDLNPIDLARARTAIEWRKQTRRHLAGD